MEEIKEVKPITMESAKNIASHKEQEELERAIFTLTEQLNNRIIEASRDGRNYIILFRYFYHPKLHTKDFVLESIFQPPYNGFNFVDPWFCDSYYNKKAFSKTIDSFKDLGYTLEVNMCDDYIVPLIRTKKLFKKPKYATGWLNYWINNAIGDPKNSEDIEKLLNEDDNIVLKSCNVLLCWN